MIEILEHSVAVETDLPTGRDHAVALSARRRLVPIVGIVAVVAATMAYSLAWGPLVLHHAVWVVKADVWGTFRTSQFVAWGDIGSVYSSGGGLVSFPGISVALAPVALLVNHLGLSSAFPVGTPHPTAWLVLGPYEAAIGSLVLIPLDSLAEELGVERRARLVSTICEAIVLWPVVAIWGHPEDPLAMAFAIWGLVAAMRGRWRAVGWLCGLALVMQPLVVLMFPIVFALAPRSERLKLALRSAVPSAGLLSAPLLQSWSQTTIALLKQPNYPAIDHATPWLSLAPVLSKARSVRIPHVHRTVLPDGAAHFGVSYTRFVYGETVAAGPGRLVAIGLAMLLGLYVYRRRPSAETVVWLCCVALGLRCVFEAVMDPYYLWPPLAIAFVLVVRSRWRLGLAVSAGGLLTWWSYRHLGPWEWWAPIVILLALVVAAAAPVPLAERWSPGSSRGAAALA
jgi:hypothetical protein